MPKAINTDQFSQSMRERSIDLDQRRLLITNFYGSDQEQDLSVPANCEGYGRVKHFHRKSCENWPGNPLPIDPAVKALGLETTNFLQAQVFQNASCNWRCWYCYVPYSSLAADSRYSNWLSAADLVNLYSTESARPKVIDLTGGQPDLVPEWIPWMMAELRSRNMEESVYLWSDDNLSNDYFWRFLTNEDRKLIASYANYGKVCCFKGYNSESFAFNTCAAPDLFQQQFDLIQRYVNLGIDVYAYVTLTTPSVANLRDDIKRFVDSLQEIHMNLPLRVVPLQIREFTPIGSRLRPIHFTAMQHQQIAVDAWQEELFGRFSASEMGRNIADVKLTRQQMCH